MRTTIPKSICLQTPVMDQAKRNAKIKNRTLSAYINDLILRDLDRAQRRLKPAQVKTRIPEDQYKLLCEIADEEGVSLAVIIRRALQARIQTARN